MFLSSADNSITVVWAANMFLMLFHVEREHTAAPECDVSNRLIEWDNLVSQRVHIHILCENYSRINP